MQPLSLLPLVLSAVAVSAVPSRLQILGAVQQFATDFQYPRLVEIAASLHYSGFADNIVGRLDITDTYQGNELFTEYVFGLFASVAKLNTTQLIGYPIDENKQLVALAVDPPVVSVSSMGLFEYGGEIGRVPVQIDAWIRYDDNLKVTQWDGVIRRFAWMQSELEPKIAKAAAKELGITGAAAQDTKRVLALRGAIDICAAHELHCKGENKQYSSTAECVRFLTEEKPFGDWSQIGMDSVICRYIHHGMLEYNPKVHCPHVGKTGGGMCQNRSFAKDTLANPFPLPFANPP